MRTGWCAGWLWVLLCWAPTGLVWGSGLDALHARCARACVEVLVDGRHAGTAWFASTNGLAVAAAHMFEARDGSVRLQWLDNRRVAARVLALDRGHDLALLQAECGVGRDAVLPLAARDPAVGEALHQFGAPLFRAGLLQQGRVAAPGTMFEFQPAVVDYAEVVAIAGTLQGGTSGGPWLNARGQVVGVQSSVMSLDGRPVGVSFMAPRAAVARLLASRRDAVTPSLGMGVDEVWQQSAEYLAKIPAGATGLVVSVVRRDGPAARAGLESGDLLVEAGGRGLVRIADLPRAVRARAPGMGLELKLLRAGDVAVRTVTLEPGVLEEWKP